MITTEGIIIRLQCSDISILGRITSGVKLIKMCIRDRVIPHTYVTGLNHLFSYDSRTGTYSYDSDKNYAYYDIDSSRNTEKNFIVYERSKDKGEGNRHVA